LMDTPIDSHFVNMLESELEKSTFVRVDSDIIDKLIRKNDELPSKLSEDEKKLLTPVIEQMVDQEKFHVSFENLSETEPPMIITQPEFMRRMKDMSLLGGMNYMSNLPDSFMLVINSNHPLIYKVAMEKDEAVRERLIRQAIDLAMLSRNLLKGEKLTEFIKRSVELI